MGSGAVLAIDQGTSSTKAVLLGREGHLLGEGTAPLAIEHPQPGWVQQDPEALWESVRAAVRACRAAAGDVEPEVLGISNQRESVLLWDRASGKALTPLVSWQCRRTADRLDRLSQADLGPAVAAKTGLPLDPLFPAAKLAALWESLPDPDPDPRAICAGTVDSWLLWKLTGGTAHATDTSNASRTQLLDLRTLAWDPGLAELFGVPLGILPEVKPSAGFWGRVAGTPELPEGLPIRAILGDSHAALYGQGGFAAGDAKATFGTGCSLMVRLPGYRPPAAGLTTTVAWSDEHGPVYAWEGNILVSAAVFPWMATVLGLEGEVEALLDLAESVPDSGGCHVVPAHVGLGAPHWRPEARALMDGISFGTGRGQLARAATDSLAFQVADLVEAARREGDAPLRQLLVDGGPTRRRFLLQRVADLSDCPVVAATSRSASALGAAFLAGRSHGLWEGEPELERLLGERPRLPPALPAAAREDQIRGWRQAVRRCTLATEPTRQR